MSFLDWLAEEVLPSRRVQQQRRRVVLDLLDKFGRAFPEVTYELLWESPTINAQAWRLGSPSGDHKIRIGLDAGARDGPSFGRITPRSRYAMDDLARSGRLLGSKYCDAENLGTWCVWSDVEGG